MALFFTCFVAALILHKIPIIRDILIVVAIVIAISLIIAVGKEYINIQNERENIGNTRR